MEYLLPGFPVPLLTQDAWWKDGVLGQKQEDQLGGYGDNPGRK